jgi:hypothetical protein
MTPYLARAAAACRLPIRVEVGPAGVYYIRVEDRWNMVYRDHDAARQLYVAARDKMMEDAA